MQNFYEAVGNFSFLMYRPLSAHVWGYLCTFSVRKMNMIWEAAFIHQCEHALSGISQVI